MAKIWSIKLQKHVYPKDLPVGELVRILNSISVDTSEYWLPETQSTEAYAAIKEAIRRLKNQKRNTGKQNNEQ